MAMETESSSAILQLAPMQVAEKLEELISDETIDRDTLFVWDIDDTLIQAGSDCSPLGVRVVCSQFPQIIRKTQDHGVKHIALTNASPFDNRLKFRRGVLELVSIPEVVSRNTCPFYWRRTGASKESVTFKDLRIAGLKHIGIDFTNSEWQQLPRELTTIQFNYDMEQYSGENALPKTVSRDGKVLEAWFDADSQKECRHIQMGTTVPGFTQDGRKRHFVQSDDSLSEVVCNPIFSRGIIFCNFINLYTQYYYGHIKGNILQSFLNEYEKQSGRKFSKVIFIDDNLAYVENVVEVMEEINVPCIGINILTSMNNV
ncbi:MAG: DUF2608 domain-containing protein [Puniceicoccales bacterium]|jgi:hypothetical protein|nr:DUF2608 domain-containing protein [Puniceicoccales bacterium]